MKQSTFRNPNNPNAKAAAKIGARQRRGLGVTTLAERRRACKPEMQLCDGCGKVEEHQGPTWCDCNPSAPWQMVELSIRELTTKTISKVYNLKG
jgi:hypothetical protein